MERVGGWRWSELRQYILERDNYCCDVCGKLAVEVDHIEPISIGGGEFDTSNLQPLCYLCHKKKTRKDHQKIAKKKIIAKMLKRRNSSVTL